MKRKQNLVLRHIGRDYIIIDPSEGVVDMAVVYTLNDTAAWLWQQLGDGDFSVESVATLLMEHYGIDLQKAEKDANDLIENLKTNSLLAE